MKISKKAKEFLAKTGKKTEARTFVNRGGRNGAEKDFNELLKRASKPVPKQPEEPEPKSNQT